MWRNRAVQSVLWPVVAGGLLLAACGGGSSTVSLAATIGTRTEAARTFDFAVTGHFSGPSDPSQATLSFTENGVVDLSRKALRLTRTGEGTPSFEEIIIGPDAWTSNPAASVVAGLKPWIHYRTISFRPPFGVDPETLLAQLETYNVTLKVVGHEVVRGVPTVEYLVTTHGRTTTTTVPGESATNTFSIWVDGTHLVRRVKVALAPVASPSNSSGRTELTYEFFNFGVAADIEPPPADQVSNQVSDGVSIGSPASPTTAVKLPPATVTGPSPLQLRPVISQQSGSCPAASASPAPYAAARFPGSGGCYLLGPVVLTITHAAVNAQPGLNNELTLDVTFNQADSVAFNEMAARYLERQVAIVMFGRVLMAPTIQAAQYNGTAQILPVDPQTAANVIAALSG